MPAFRSGARPPKKTRRGLLRLSTLVVAALVSALAWLRPNRRSRDESTRTAVPAIPPAAVYAIPAPAPSFLLVKEERPPLPPPEIGTSSDQSAAAAMPVHETTSGGTELRSAAISGLVSAVGMLVFLFASGIFSARALGPTDRGYFALQSLTQVALCQLGALGISLSLTHFVASRQISARDALRELRRPIITQLVLVAVAVLLLGLALNWGHPTYARIGAAMFVGGVATAFARDYGLAVLQGCGLTSQGNYLRTLPPALWTVGIATVYFVHPDSLIAAVICFLFSDSISSAAILIAARRAVRRQAEVNIPQAVGRHEILTYGRKGFFAYLSPLENFRLDQFFVSVHLSATSLGYYATGSAFMNIPRTIAVNLGMTASPIVSAAESRGASKRTAGLVFIWLTIAITVVVTALLAAATTVLIPLLFGEPFRPAIPICQVLLISGPLMAIRRIVVDVLRGAGRPVGTKAELAGLAVFLVSAPLLANELGAVGVAWAFVAATLANLLLLVAIERRRTLPSSVGTAEVAATDVSSER